MKKNSTTDIDALLDKALLPFLAELPNKATAAETKLVKNWNEGQIKRHKEFLIQLADK